MDSEGGARFKRSRDFEVTPTLSQEDKEAARWGILPPLDNTTPLPSEPATELENLSYSPAPTTKQILPLAPNLDEEEEPELILPPVPNLDKEKGSQPGTPSTFIRPNLRIAAPRKSAADILVEEEEEKMKNVEVRTILEKISQYQAFYASYLDLHHGVPYKAIGTPGCKSR